MAAGGPSSDCDDCCGGGNESDVGEEELAAAEVDGLATLLLCFVEVTAFVELDFAVGVVDVSDDDSNEVAALPPLVSVAISVGVAVFEYL